MNPFIKKLLYLTLGLLSPLTCVCNINFTDAGGNIVIDTTNSALSVSNPTKIVGWGQRSVVKMFGDNASTAWPETYTNTTIVAQSGAGTTPARTTLVDANSNAICAAPTLLRTTSNLLLYTARTYSSSIVVLGRRTDSANVSIRGTSNAINLFYTYLPVPTTDSIDGTQFMRYHTAHHVFHNGASTIRGWVRFNNGFTIMPQGTVSMDTLTTVSGPIDLRDTGLLKLNNDLYLSHNVTLTAGGYIKGNAANYGQANTIFMGGDLTLANDNYAKVLHITGDWANNGQSGDLIIDGCGHTLNIGSQAQIFVDQNITLTLRNMTIKTSPASFLKPAIQLASMGSKLALDNVMFDLGADFQFGQGQLFIHDDVAVTGTSAFIYSSPKPSYITSGATWSFETGTTFSIAPATYTDQPFTAGTATSNNFIVLADQTAALSLSGCSLKTTFTGARFTKGMVLFDNKVAIDTQAGVDLAMSATGVGLLDVDSTVTNVAFSPDGRYVATTYEHSNSVYTGIYRFNGTSPMTYVAAPVIGPTTGIPALAWSPDSRFLASGGKTYFRIYGFNSTISTPVIAQQNFGLIVNSISWSPDGRYLAVGGNNGTTPLIVYRFDGTTLTQVTTANPGGSSIQVNGVAWSPDGKYLTTASRLTGGYAGWQLYSFNGFSLSTVTSATYPNSDSNSYATTWSPDGRYITWGYRTNTNIGQCQIYKFNGTVSGSLPLLNLGTQVNAVSFSPDGRYLLACGVNNGAGRFQLYRINVSGATALLAQDQPFGTVATTVAWSPDSKYVLIGGTNATTGQQDLMVYPVIKTATAANTQGFSNGLLFGDKAKGVDFDASIRVMGSATVKVRGMVKDDSF